MSSSGVVSSSSEPLLDVRQTAALLSLSVPTIRRRIYDGTLPHVKIGGVIRLRPRDLERFLRAVEGVCAK